MDSSLIAICEIIVTRGRETSKLKVQCYSRRKEGKKLVVSNVFLLLLLSDCLKNGRNIHVKTFVYVIRSFASI